MTRREKALIHNEKTRAVSRNKDTSIPPLAGTRARKGKCPQKVGMWGTLSTDYKTPGMTTHDSRWSQTVQNRSV